MKEQDKRIKGQDDLKENQREFLEVKHKAVKNKSSVMKKFNKHGNIAEQLKPRHWTQAPWSPPAIAGARMEGLRRSV